MRIFFRSLELSLVICLTLASLCAGIAHGEDASAIDYHALAAPKEKTSAVSTLASYLSAKADTDRKKARSIYVWITHNVAVDADSYFSGSGGITEPADVLKLRRATCYGYASLYKSLAHAMKLDVRIISGHAKGYLYSPGSIDTRYPNHSWNAVKIDGRWQLLDCSWGAGYIDSAQKFVRKPQDYYFLTNPREFAASHFPEDQKWQLLDAPISLDDYANMVNLRSAFFECRLELGNAKECVFKTNGAEPIELHAPGDVSVIAELLRNGIEVSPNPTIVQRDGDNVRIHVRYPEPGRYALRIYSKPSERPGVYDWAAEYIVECTGSAGSDLHYPEALSAYVQRNASLVAPMNGRLNAGTKNRFKLVVPGAKKVAVISGNKWTYLQKNGETFEGEVSISNGKVSVAALFGNNATYDVLLKYQSS